MSGLSLVVDFSGAPSNPGGSLRLAADVRLDNRQELIDLLSQPGDIGDTEILLAAWRRWGESCPLHLLGDFAFVLWDARQRRIFAACDPMGVKPLCYARVGSTLFLASDTQTILRHPAIPRRLDEITMGAYLLDGECGPERTFFQDVLRLPPGHRLVATSEDLRVERYWTLDPDARTIYKKEEDYAEHFLDLFRKSVSDRLRTTAGPVGVLMSGGLDSTSVAAVARQSVPEGGLFSASFIFDELHECDERRYVQAVTASLGIESELIPAERCQVLADPVAGRPGLEGPFCAWDAALREALRRARDRGARVLLTGHGGDDLMSGSPLVNGDRLRSGDPSVVLEVARHAAANRRAWRWIVYYDLLQPALPSAADRAVRRLFGKRLDAMAPDWIDASFVRRIGLDEPPAQPPRRFRERARQALYDHVVAAPWAPAASWYDHHAAGFGIEVRHPFLDRRLAEYLVSIPPSRLFRTGLSKPLLRQAMAGLLPETVRLRRGKTSLRSFVDLAFGAEARQARVEEWLAAPVAEELGFVNADRLRATYRRRRTEGPTDLDPLLWCALALELWLRENGLGMLEGASVVSPAA